MSAIAEFFRRLVVRSGDSVLLDHGSITTPQQPTGTTITGEPVVKRTLSLAAGASATLWDWTVDSDFAIFLIECSGFVWIEQTVDSPVSGSNNAASGNATQRPKEGLSCIAPMVIQGMSVPIVPTSGGTQQNYVASFGGTTANGRRYKIVAKNPSSTDAIDLTIAWAK